MADAPKAGAERSEAISVGDALRAAGFGPVAYANGLRALAESLEGKATYARVLLETLRECGRHLHMAYEMNRETSEFAGGDADVVLVHKVARPAHEKRNAEAQDRQIGFQFDEENL